MQPEADPPSHLGCGLPRAVEACIALAGLAVAAPFLLVAAAAVAATSPGGALFRQARMGRGGRPFTIFKLRTMYGANSGPGMTSGGDHRITPVGRVLRKTKLDEFPELWNIVRGDMSLVGPRPEVVRYVDLADPRWQLVLRARPGLTDPVTLRLRNEEGLLAGVAGDAEVFYRETLQPYKLRGYAEYLRRRTPGSDVAVLWHTVLAVLLPGRAVAPTVEEIGG